MVEWSLRALASRKFELSLEVHLGSEAVSEVEKEIIHLQGSTSPEILEFAPKIFRQLPEALFGSTL